MDACGRRRDIGACSGPPGPRRERRALPQLREDPVELFEARVADDDLAGAIGLRHDRHRRAERFGELLLQPREIGIGRAARRASRCAGPGARTGGPGAPSRAPTAPARPRAPPPPSAAPRTARAARAHGPCRSARASGMPAPASRARAGAGDWSPRCASGRPPSPPRRASSRIRRSADGGRSPARADSGLRAGCSRSAPARAPTDRAPPSRAPARSLKPARFAARQRRSPATISKRPPSIGRTRIGCITPCSRIDAASSSSAASSICVRG